MRLARYVIHLDSKPATNIMLRCNLIYGLKIFRAIAYSGGFLKAWWKRMRHIILKGMCLYLWIVTALLRSQIRLVVQPGKCNAFDQQLLVVEYELLKRSNFRLFPHWILKEIQFWLFSAPSLRYSITTNIRWAVAVRVQLISCSLFFEFPVL